MFSRWSRPNGYRDVLRVGLPLVISMTSTTVMHFTDRVFLGNYSLDAIAAATPSGITVLVFMCLFFGTASYVNVFIAQYIGSGAYDRVGAALWQGIYFALAGWILLAGMYFIANPLFNAGGHSPEVIRLEVIYFRILILGSGFEILRAALSCFYSGRGLTRPVMFVNMTAAGLNIPLDYALINGVGFFPELGIAGAAIATVAASAFSVVLFVFIVFTPANNRQFMVIKNRALDFKLFGRLLKFGFPGGVHLFLELFAITFFIFMIGRLGKTELAATNIVFSINTLAFLPMIGFSIAISTLVGQAIGREKPEDAVEATRSTIHIALLYMSLIAVVFLVFPEWLVNLFRAKDHGAENYGFIVDIGIVLLRFVALYSIFDALAIVYSGAVKGAGDTAFVMRAMAAASIFIMVIPVYVLLVYFNASLFILWIVATLYISSLGVVFWWRYSTGKWKTMRVIEAGAVLEGAG